MVTDAAAMAVVRAARPALRGAHDGVAFAAHAAFLAAGYSLCAVGPAALADPSPLGDEEVGIDGWNSMENCYAFLYSKEEKGKKKRVLVKCLVIGEVLAIDVLDLEAQDKGPYNIQINVKDFFVEEQPKNYGDMYKNFANLIDIVNSNVLWKLDGDDVGAEAAKSAAAAKNSDAERSSSMQSLIYPPIAPLGSDDLYPGPGAGFYPHSGIGSGGSMLIGPNDPRFFPSSNPFNAPFGGPGSVPPGGRYDPIGPPGVPGFEPSSFVRRPRRPPGGSTHPDLEFFQQGPDF
ncbi:probable proteasome inhibitor isoform X2 [Miscanthus floridulus]|uniref:probable proteasome inhibitor isoform X2 n=1 Tax=Miscanthus floridulus TaxID=154761 RepID=UPI003458F57E